MTDIRRIAYDTLLLIEDGKFDSVVISDVMDKYSYLDRQDRNFLKRLIETVVERRLTLDYVINLYSKLPARKMKKKIRTLLRMGTCQLLYMDGVADHAAVSETVKLAGKTAPKELKGFVNAILRKIADEKDSIKWPDDSDEVFYLSVMYSCPVWLSQMLLNEHGRENAETLLKLSLCARGVTARVNMSKSSVEDVVRQGFAKPSDICDIAVILDGYDMISDIPSFSKGQICIQDISSMLVCMAASIKNTDTVIDLCASPGGKTLHAADLAQNGRVISFDVSKNKLSRIRENVERCGFSNVEIRQGDASELNEELIGLADVVIADVPCSGLGVIGRKPDIKYNVSEEGIASLVALQRKILKNAALYVKPGGTLMFSTCTCTKAENLGNMEFLKKECLLTPVSFFDLIPRSLAEESAASGYLQLFGKDEKTDGFFLSRFAK